MTIAFIEGLPAGGKTHLLRYIESQGIPVINELGRTIDPSEFPGDGKSVEEILRIHEWFIEKEQLRFKNNHSCVYERSFITQLGYAFAYPKYMNMNAFEEGIAKYTAAISSGTLPLPDIIFYVPVSIEESIKRQNQRTLKGEQTALPEFWTKESFLNDLIRADEAFLSATQGIDTIFVDCKLTTEEKFNQIEPYLRNLDKYKSNNKSIDMDLFIQKLK